MDREFDTRIHDAAHRELKGHIHSRRRMVKTLA